MQQDREAIRISATLVQIHHRTTADCDMFCESILTVKNTGPKPIVARKYSLRILLEDGRGGPVFPVPPPIETILPQTDVSFHAGSAVIPTSLDQPAFLQLIETGSNQEEKVVTQTLLKIHNKS